MSTIVNNYDDYNKIQTKAYYNSNYRLHREDGPAEIFYYEDGNLRSEEWYVNGIAHRVYGPSDIFYYRNGKIRNVRWYYTYINYTYVVNEWIKNNEFNSWKDMTESDFDRMWFEIL